MTAQHHFWLGKRKFSASYASGVYPVDVQESLGVGLTLVEARLIDPPSWADGLGTALSLTAGAMSTVLVGAQDLAAVGTSLSLTGGTLVSALASHTLPPEDAVGTSLSLTSGTLSTVLITHTLPPEDAIGTSLTLTGGTLA